MMRYAKNIGAAIAVSFALVVGSVAGASADEDAASETGTTEPTPAELRAAATDRAAEQQSFTRSKASKKASKKLKKFTAQVHKYAKKKAGNPKAWKSNGGFFKASKKHYAYVGMAGREYVLNPPSKRTAKKYTTAAMSKLKKHGLKKVSSAKSKATITHSVTYANSRYTCTVTLNNKSSYAGLAELTCQRTALVKKRYAKLKPFIVAYKKAGKNPRKLAFIGSWSGRSASSSYSDYRKGTTGMFPAGSNGQMGASRALYSKAPGHRWILADTPSGSAGPYRCERLERSATHKRAWAWEDCSRNGSIRANSTVYPY